MSSSARPTSPPPHRHNAAALSSLHVLTQLSEQATTHLTLCPGPTGIPPDVGIIDNLSSHGWDYRGTTNGIRIFSLEDDLQEDEMEEDERVKGRRKGGGTRGDESLPWARGEGWIAGGWRMEDVAATSRSLGARAVWDTRFDSMQSAMVAHLSETDTLMKMAFKGTFPVGDRDSCIVTTESEVEGVLYVSTTSVKDALIPKIGIRTNIHLSGFCLRPLPRSPNFERPPDPDPVRPDACKIPVRPGHLRTKSSLSIAAIQGAQIASSGAMVPPPPLNKRASYALLSQTPPIPSPVLNSPAPSRPPSIGPRYPSTASARKARIARASSGLSAGGTLGVNVEEEVAPVQIYRLDRPETAAKDNGSKEIQGGDTEGLHVSLIVRASPGGNLPTTYVNQLSLNLPLGIASINRYLLSYGFAPYILTGPEIQVMDESFDCAAASYRVVYRIRSTSHPSPTPSDTRIRFHGSTFARGHFQLEVLHAPSPHRIAYDVPASPTSSSIPSPSFSGINNSSISRPSFNPPSLPSLTSHTDPAKFPGSAGGCTLYIPTPPPSSHPISVTISAAHHAQPPLAQIRKVSQALREANEGGEGGADSIEELLDEVAGVGWAERGLAGTKGVLERLRRAREISGEF